MAKIYQLINNEMASQEALTQHVEDLLSAVKSGEVKNLMVAAQNQDGDILIGYCNLDMGEKQNLLSHVQVNIMHDIVKVNKE